jgi:hypothetical protein
LSEESRLDRMFFTLGILVLDNSANGSQEERSEQFIEIGLAIEQNLVHFLKPKGAVSLD